MTDQVNEAVAWVVPSVHVAPDGSYEDGPDGLVLESEATDYIRRIGTPLYTHPSRGVVGEDVVMQAERAFWPAYNEALRVHGTKADCHAIGMRAALQAAALPAVPELLSADDVQWIVNDNSELGVMIRGQCFFLYKGDSLVYEDAKHDDGSPMFIRAVGKREFGECCHPIGDDISACGYQHRWGEVSLGDSDRWQPMPAATPAHDQPEGSDNG